MRKKHKCSVPFRSRCREAAEVIELLVAKDPQKRPTADQLLKEKLSFEVEEEMLKATLQGVSPGMKKYQYILDRVFHVDSTTEYFPQKSYDDKSAELREMVVEVVERVFRTHGAKKIETPIFERAMPAESSLTVKTTTTTTTKRSLTNAHAHTICFFFFLLLIAVVASG